MDQVRREYQVDVNKHMIYRAKKQAVDDTHGDNLKQYTRV